MCLECLSASTKSVFRKKIMKNRSRHFSNSSRKRILKIVLEVDLEQYML
jgi:hypothetical protein